MEIDILATFKSLYGYEPTKLSEFFQIDKSKPLRRSRVTAQSLYGQEDQLGRAVFCPLTIVGRGKRYEFPNCVLGTRRSKKIVETDMPERNGTVKEIIGSGNWEITVKGFLFNHLNELPDLQLAEIHELFKINEPIILECAFTDLFLDGTELVYIIELDLPGKPKVEGVRDFQMKIEVDEPFILYKS
jgi:hypothetical protein